MQGKKEREKMNYIRAPGSRKVRQKQEEKMLSM